MDIVCRHDGKRELDFRKGRRLGRYDHVVDWIKPQKPRWMSHQLYAGLPDSLSIRQLKVEVRQRGFRCRHLHIVTTLLDAQLYCKDKLATAFRCRWHAELDLRSIKQVMQMDVLRCKSPAMVRKEIWMHLLAYNLIRTLMARAALDAGVCPRDISFKGTLQTMLALVLPSVGFWVTRGLAILYSRNIIASSTSCPHPPHTISQSSPQRCFAGVESTISSGRVSRRLCLRRSRFESVQSVL